ncbi:hypothetical protein [Paractinoplanes atraurantiacus]|uniref:hypothetical protein n=1 Tax=Paractinoplanes atraurantiacus TaxID=1036182 RepID=UPI0011776411|nr:hypothetical protein [Actinoplanes atraurantiacus]
MTEYDADQLTAGFRSMTMLTALVGRGGRPAAVSPTIALRAAEKQYGWLPVRIGDRQQIAVITNLRLILAETEVPLWAITRIRPGDAPFAVALEIIGREEPLVLSGPWVPWMSVVICAELYGTAWPPAYAPAPGNNRENLVTA